MNIDLDTGRLIVFVGGLFIFAIMERFMASRSATNSLGKRIALHSLIAAVNTTLVRILIYVPLLAWIVYVEQMGWGAARWLGLNGAAEFVVSIVVLDAFDYFWHRANHRIPFLWRFHKVHHSVEEMGFAAHLRYHWMENIFYKPLKTLAVMVVGGFEPSDAYMIHFIAVLIGHLNHANIRLTFGPLKYILNNPVMHLYHHAKELPKGQMPGVNFGISLSLWDYIFKTNYIPQDQDGNYALGFDGVEQFPKTFWGQVTYGFKPSSKAKNPDK